MDWKYLTVGACVTSLALPVLMTPVLAGVSQAQRAACERAAEHVSPPLYAGEKEAWIANCLADAAGGSPPKKNRHY